MAPADDWVARTAGEVRAEAERRHPGEAPTCASGISPSGPVHLGNLRELMVPHLIADEIRKQGAPCRHILSWDDYDRLRRVPAGFPESFAEHIGRPLSSVPDPCGRHQNWAEHFKEPLREALARLGVRVTEISQTQMYTSGAYTEQIVTAMRRRADIGAVLAKYQTRRGAERDDDDPQTAVYYPFRPYCAVCGRDDTMVTAFDDQTTEITYTCACGARVGPLPIARVAGKLAWKVDWPMRWAYERVTFEPAGVDHASPGSSFTVGGELVSKIFGGQMPLHFQYAFVGFTGGSSKISSSVGRAPTPADALEIFEAPLLRWLYTRRASRAGHHAGLRRGGEPGLRRVGRAEPTRRRRHRHRRGAGRLRPRVRHRRGAAAGHAAAAAVPHAGLGGGHHGRRPGADPAHPAGPDAGRPDRLAGRGPAPAGLRAAPGSPCTSAPDDRTQVRDEPDAERLAALTDSERDALKLLTEGMAADWSLHGLTTLLYGIPKLQRGLPIDAPPTPEIKADQRAWFTLLYQLLVGKDTGPRLPTLLLALGQDRIRALLTPG